MESDTDDQECLYDSLPEICDASPSLYNENLASSSGKEINSSSSTGESRSKNDASVNKSKKNSVKKCSCRNNVHWMWDNDSKSQYVDIVNDRKDVRFHRTYSNGTAVVRCTEPMTDNQYYWEVKMTCPVYGTDIMVGVGTSDVEMKHIDDRFVSFLGMDNQTWGFSYTGLFHHNGQRRCYAERFGQGNVIGVHLDLWRGTITFYKDRKCLGVASYGLKGKTFYAMASSTAARSGMRIVYSRSFPSSLQFLCCSVLREIVPDDESVLDYIDIPPGLRHFLATKLNWLLDKRSLDESGSRCCRILDGQNDYDDEIGSEEVDYDQVPSYDEDNDTSSEDLSPPAPGRDRAREFILFGSVLFSNYNRFVGAVRNNISPERDSASESDAKRRRFSYNYTMGLSDHDSD